MGDISRGKFSFEGNISKEHYFMGDISRGKYSFQENISKGTVDLFKKNKINKIKKKKNK